MRKEVLFAASAIVLAACSIAHAFSSVVPEDEYKKKIRVSDEISPLSEHPFGDSVSLYNGALSFRQVDIQSEGTGPSIAIARSFRVPDLSPTTYYEEIISNAMVDWQVQMPRLETYSAQISLTNSSGQTTSQWFFLETDNRCSSFQAGPDLVIAAPHHEEAEFASDKWWHGYQLHIDGAARDLLSRDASNTSKPQISQAGVPTTFPIVTTDQWQVGCLATTSNGKPGEGFLAISPDGTKYWLDWVASKKASTMIRRSGGSLDRRIIMMMASRVEDRFGNYVNYTYDDAGNPQSIVASDGRSIAFTYETWTRTTGEIQSRVKSITQQPGAQSQRIWSYHYSSDANLPRLVSVALPDGSSWQFDMAGLVSPVVGGTEQYTGCTFAGVLAPGATSSATINHPSGLTGVFTVQPITRGLSYVPKICDNVTVAPAIVTPHTYRESALIQETISGAGMTAQTWKYAYSPPNESWASDCSSGCASQVWTDVTDPNGNATRYTFSNVYDSSASKLLHTDQYSGAVASGNLLRSVTSTYASAIGGPWPARYGSAMQPYINRDQVERNAPEISRVIAVSGDTYTWQAGAFNTFAQPTLVTRTSSANTQTYTEQTSYLNDLPHWVLGLPTTVVNGAETVSQMDYNLASVTPLRRYRFGQLLMTYSFSAAGQLASFTDGNSHTTTLSNYKLGIPKSITFPDNTSMSLEVDDYGQISSITNQAGNTTNYGYDAIGRVQDITYPAGDSTPWAPKHFDYALASAPALGLPDSHFVRTVTQGARVATTHFDAMMRPILDIRMASNGSLAVSSSTDYDWRGNKTFQSYPVDGTPARSSITAGVSSTYDALGRVSSTIQPSELGNLTTTTNYLSGARKQVIDPKGNSTTTSYQVFDQPSYDAVTRVEAPEGVVQAIDRDIFGNPKSITQSGGGVTPVAKFMRYDRYHRLCRTVEPESGSEVMAYDGANNLSWSAQGQSIQDVVDPNDADKICGWDQVAPAARTTRTYYSTNQVENISYPGGTASTHMTYTATGKPWQATSGTVEWIYGYNKLDLLESQVLAVDGYNWTIEYRYDGQGTLKSTKYPDFKEVSYLPDAHGRPTAAGSYATGAAYYPDGDLKSFTFGSGASYLGSKDNSRNLLSNFTYGTASAMAVSEDLAYDRNANITQITDLTNAGQRTKVLGYDGLNRLTSAASNLWGGTESYTYDTLNNIRTLTAAGVTNTYNYDGSNRLASITSGASTVASFGYDNRGNVTSKNAMALVFDEANRLTQITGLDSYLYDAEGRRVKKAPASGTPTYYAYSQSGQLLWQYDPTTVTGTDYIYLGKKMVASTVNATIPTVAPTLSGPATGQVNVGYTLTWTAVPGGATYQLQEQVNGAAFNLVSNLNQLSQGTAHTGPATFGYRVAACNAAGCGPWSSTVNVVVQPPPSAPSPPASINATLAGDLSSISVSWGATSDTTSYVAQVQVNGGSWGAFYSGTGTSSVLSTPADGTYKFQVHSCNANGCSAWTGPTTTITVAHLPTVPAAISVPATSSGPIAIGWSTSTYQTSYSLERSFNGGAFGAIYNGAGNSYSYTATSTGTYAYRVRACNANGCSGYGPTGTSTITIPPASAPGISAPGTSNNGAYTVSWTGVGGAATYNLQEQVNSGGFATLQNTAATSRAISGKGNGTYGYRVQACNAGGCGPFSGTASVAVALVPSPPSSVQFIDYFPNTHTEAYKITWTAVSGISRYEVIRADTSVQIYSGTATTFNVGSGPFGTYVPPYSSAKVRACNANGCSAWKLSENVVQ